MMNRRHFLTTAAGLPIAACSQFQSKTGKPPNVLYILTDDQRWDCLSVAGHPFLKTPHLDRIANEGARFANAFVTTSICSPSRASFLSGKYAHQHGVQNNFTDYPRALPSWPVNLKRAGYDTAYVGKWHMGEEDDSARPGFDHWISHKGQGKYWDTEFNINGQRQTVKGYYTHTVTEMTLDWLKARPGNKPFAMCLGHKAPHGIWIPEPKYEHVYDDLEVKKPETAYHFGPNVPSFVKERVRTWHGIDGNLYGHKSFEEFIRCYHATILSVDDSVGAIYDALRQSGELDNTFIVFAGDNGFLLGEHASIDKRTMWEESIRIPLLMRYPAAIPKPVVVNEMVLNQDVAPTVLDVCGAEPLPDIPARSCRRLLAGEPDPEWRKSFYYSYNYEAEFPYTPNVRGVRTDDWKFTHYPNGDESPDKYLAELYDLRNDPLEKSNLINEPGAQEQVTQLKAELRRLQESLGAWPDAMPVNPQLKMELPEESIR
ncbi:MAG: sulfatase [Bryobacteraceae bacterium]|nr:sulfatase [Bryobacteraceae bacterium]